MKFLSKTIQLKNNQVKWGAIVLSVALLSVLTYFFVDQVVLEYTATPTLQLQGETNITLEAGTTIQESGFHATIRGENADKHVQILGEIDSTKLGEQKIEYVIANKKGTNKISKTRTVTIVDTTPPQIALNGQESVELYVGDTYHEQSAVATDSFEGDVSANIQIKSDVDTSKVGSYTVNYTAFDSSQNQVTATRYVLVKEKKTLSTKGKTVYLTFDDGPSKNTKPILDLLKKYNAKATFFVIGKQLDSYSDLLMRMVQEGHTIAVHSNTHNYAQIYSSQAAFWLDIQTMSDRIEKITRIRPQIMRFPGGSSNQVSAKYSKGIMSALTAQAADQGYLYCDWNISSEDATGGSVPAATIAAHVLNGIKRNIQTPIVLMHDGAAKETTVAALEIILKESKEKNIQFAAMTTSTPMIHHGVKN